MGIMRARRTLYALILCGLLASTAMAQIIGGGMVGARRYRALQFLAGDSQVELTGDEALALSGEAALSLAVSVNPTKGPS